jgi:hypothetical protein
MKKKPAEDMPTVVLSATQPIQMRVEDQWRRARCGSAVAGHLEASKRCQVYR